MRAVGHTGSLPGWSADFTMVPDRGYVLIVVGVLFRTDHGDKQVAGKNFAGIATT